MARKATETRFFTVSRSDAVHLAPPPPPILDFLLVLSRCRSHRKDVDATTLSAAVKGRLRATGDKLLKRVAAESKAAAAAAAQSGVRQPTLSEIIRPGC